MTKQNKSWEYCMLLGVCVLWVDKVEKGTTENGMGYNDQKTSILWGEAGRFVGLLRHKLPDATSGAELILVGKIDTVPEKKLDRKLYYCWFGRLSDKQDLSIFNKRPFSIRNEVLQFIPIGT